MLKPAPGLLESEGAFAFLVLNQTCDCINPDLEKEPYLELLPLEKLNGKPDSRLKNGCNPRQIHFQIQEDGQAIWVNAKVTEIISFDRSAYESLEITSGYSIEKNVLNDLVQWRAQRYVRTAFPDSFEIAFRSLSKDFGGLMAKHADSIDSLLISLLPFDELEEGDCYSMQLHLMVKPELMGKPEMIEELQKTAKEITELLKKVDCFDSPICSVTSLDKMSLWEARNFLDFSRYDHLSFGQEDSAPDHPDASS